MSEPLHPENESFKKERKLPEFIIIEESETHYESEGPFKKENPFQEKEGLYRGSWKVKLFCLFVSILSFLIAVGALCMTLLVLVINLVTLNSFLPVRRILSIYYNLFKATVVITLGLVVAGFYFPLGMMIILFYFSDLQDSWQKRVVTKIIKPHTSPFWQS